MGLENIACCYHKLTAYLIQYLLLASSVLGLIFNIIAFIVILWDYIPSFITFLYVLDFIFNLISFGSIGLLIYYRQQKTINNKNNKKSIKISSANIGLSLAGILFAVICLIVCSVEYYDHETDEEDGEKVITGWDKFFMFLTMGFNLRLIIFLFFFWVSILIRLIKKTSGSYTDNDAIAINISNLSIEGNTNNTNNVNNTNNNINKKDNNNGNNNIVRDVKVSYGIRELSLK